MSCIYKVANVVYLLAESIAKPVLEEGTADGENLQLKI